jgi:hypothetical protein
MSPIPPQKHEESLLPPPAAPLRVPAALAALSRRRGPAPLQQGARRAARKHLHRDSTSGRRPRATARMAFLECAHPCQRFAPSSCTELKARASSTKTTFASPQVSLVRHLRRFELRMVLLVQRSVCSVSLTKKKTSRRVRTSHALASVDCTCDVLPVISSNGAWTTEKKRFACKIKRLARSPSESRSANTSPATFPTH